MASNDKRKEKEEGKQVNMKHIPGFIPIAVGNIEAAS